jgi:phosphate:Na+ symporter
MPIGLLSNIFTLFGGLGMFLYGMTVMSDGMQKAAGSKMSGFIDMVTKNRFMAVLLGAGITALIQSSSATTVMVVGFVNAGVLNLSQSVGIIMGANIGTTITAWMVSLTQVSSDMLAILKPEFFAPVLIGFGAFRMLLGKKGTDDLGGTICMGVGLIFIGLQFMGKAVEPYADSPMFATAFLLFGRNPVLGILAGAIITGIIQSSAASVSILQTLALAGAVPRASGFYITLGQNIGTCVTAMISSTGTSRTAKRAACIHLLFNVTGAVIFGVVIFAASLFQPAFFSSNLTPVEISIFHTIFNVSCTLILFPFGDALVKMSDILVRKEGTGYRHFDAGGACRA